MTNTRNSRVTVEVLKKLEKGDSINDDELKIAIVYLTIITEFTTLLSEKYHLFHSSLIQSLYKLEDFKDYRKVK